MPETQRTGRHQVERPAASTEPFPVEVTWLDGSRNEAWDELWRRIFRDVLGSRAAHLDTVDIIDKGNPGSGGSD